MKRSPPSWVVLTRFDELMTWMRTGHNRVASDRVLRLGSSKLIQQGYADESFRRLSASMSSYEDHFEVFAVVCECDSWSNHEEEGGARSWTEIPASYVSAVLPFSPRAKQILDEKLRGLLPVEEPIWVEEFARHDRFERDFQRRLAALALLEMYSLTPESRILDSDRWDRFEAWLTSGDLESEIVCAAREYHRPIASGVFPSGPLGYFYDFGRFIKDFVESKAEASADSLSSPLSVYREEIQSVSNRHGPPGDAIIPLASRLRSSLEGFVPFFGDLPPLSVVFFFMLKDQWRQVKKISQVDMKQLVKNGGFDPELQSAILFGVALLAFDLGFSRLYRDYLIFLRERDDISDGSEDPGKAASLAVDRVAREHLGRTNGGSPAAPEPGELGAHALDDETRIEPPTSAWMRFLMWVRNLIKRIKEWFSK